MDPKQIKATLILIISIVAAWLVAPPAFSLREQPAPIPSAASLFDASRSYQMTAEFVTQFPDRVFGSLESRQSSGYIREQLEKLGYSITYTHFEGRVARRNQVGRNVLAYKQGQDPEILAVVAHTDTAKTTEQGAMDNGAGVGVALELAGVFAKLPARRSLLFVFSDGAEWGNLGAHDVALNYPQRGHIAAVLSLDHPGTGTLEAFCLEETGRLKGFTPPWLRQLARAAAEREGLPVRGVSRLEEYVERAVRIPAADQGPFLAAGIPAVNLSGISKDRARQKAIYHSEQDRIGNLTPAGLGQYGRAAERIVRSLDALPSIPDQPSGYLRLWNARYARPSVIALLQIVSFLPLPLVLWFVLKNHHQQFSAVLAGREFLALLGTMLPFWIIYFLIALFRALRQIPVYTFAPALKDPLLENPPWGILGVILGAALCIAAVCFLIALYSFREMPKPNFHVSRIVLLGLLLCVAAIALVYDRYWASLFFILPAWIWPLAGVKGTSRTAARILIAAAGLPWFAVLLMYRARLDMGWEFIWYQILALSNGLFTQTAYFLATALIALGIRFMAVQSHQRT